jgi:hypothetical protein
MGFVLAKRRLEIILRISTESPSRLGVAFADRMGSNIVNIMAEETCGIMGCRELCAVG